jgi:hypothetical protein
MSGRTLVVRTTHDDPETIAAAIQPDNTDDMHTSVDRTTIETAIDRETTSGLQATADDYVVNIHVAVQCTTNQPNDNTS